MRIAIGSDHAGFSLRRAIEQKLRSMGHEVLDCGCDNEESCDYPEFGAAVGRKVASGECDRGIVVCGTGLGIAMAANKIKGIRAAVVHDAFTARMSREHNDANVLALGARVLDPDFALELVDLWLTTDFEGGRHARRVGKIDALDR